MNICSYINYPMENKVAVDLIVKILAKKLDKLYINYIKFIWFLKGRLESQNHIPI
jgi:hypothetical protein